MWVPAEKVRQRQPADEWWRSEHRGPDSQKRARSPTPLPAPSEAEESSGDEESGESEAEVAASPAAAESEGGQAACGAGRWSTNGGFLNFAAPLQSQGERFARYNASVHTAKIQRTNSGRVTFESQVFRCAACRVDSSGEASFLQHVQGKRHLAKTKGRVFAGLLVNDAGIIPELSPRASKMLGQTFSTPQAPPLAADGRNAAAPRASGSGGSSLPNGVRHLRLPPEGERALKEALQAAGSCAEAGRRDAGDNGTSAAQASNQRRWRARPRIPPPRQAGGGPLTAQRESLPVFAMRTELLRAIREHTVVVVEGETGSGKTTQIPQYILEEAAMAGEPCSIVCTQPRRISAIGVADRVAEECGERCGGLVGYSVRLENSSCDATQLLFVTTGILLRRMEEDPELEGTTHIIVDEVHERAEESDFLLLALRSLLRRRPELRVVLMSATLDTSLFSKYFDDAPVIKVSGRTFPVKTLYLEDALKITGHVVRPGADWALGGGKGKGKGQDDSRDRQHEHPPEEFTPEALMQRYRDYGPQVWNSLKTLDHDAVDYELVVSLIQMAIADRLVPDGQPNMGAVLVFLSGIKEIQTLHEDLSRLAAFQQEPQRSWILPLHGSLPPEEQRRVFDTPPDGVRKVVLATNVAETSITINDVGVVIDTARMKENNYDGTRRVSSLEDVVVARSNAKQRRGRAGRVASGVAVHLMTKHRHDCLIPDRRLPEVKRVPLEQLVLRIHAIKITVLERPGSAGRNAAAVCSQLLEPPERDAVRKAVEELVDMDALSVDARSGTEALTPLGSRLATLPVDARIGKLILLGSVFGERILDYALTIAAALTLGSPFLRPWDKREEADKIRCRFAERLASEQVGHSDHLSTLMAYCEADSLRGGERSEFCRTNMLGSRSLQSMGALKRQLLEHLSTAGFVRQGLRAKDAEYLGRRDGSDGVRTSLLSQGSWGWTSPPPSPPRREEVPLLAALLCAALFPQVARVSLPKVSKRSKKAGKTQDAQHMKIYVQVAGQEERAKLHPSSVAARASRGLSGFIVYQELVKTTQLYVRDITQLPPLALLLFGGVLKKEGQPFQNGTLGEEVILSVGGSCVHFSVPVRLLDALYTVRGELDRLLRKHTEQGLRAGRNGYHERRTEKQDEMLLDAVARLLNYGVEDSSDEEEEAGYHGGGWGGGRGWESKKKGNKGKGDRRAQKARRKMRG